MKYTVVIRQPVPEEVRAGLEEQLVTRFQLSPEQAAKLAARRAGRLMKPTGRARAELLLHVFQDAGVPATLEEVREETAVLSGPFQGVAASPSPAPRRSSPETEAGVVLAPEPSGPFPTGPLPTGTTSSLDVPPLLGDDAWAALGTPARVQADPFAPDPFAPPSLLGGPDPVAPVPAASPEPAGEVQASAPPASQDIWSDFTGALTVPEATPQPQEAPGAAETYLTAVSEEPKGHLGPRRSLARQLTFGALTPLILSTGVTLGLLISILPGLQRQLVEQNAQAVAVAVGTSLDTRDQETVNAQLDALLRRSAVGFVRVELPDGTTYFRSATPELDGVLQGRVARFLEQNPETGTFVASGSPADAYREQLGQLTEVGAGNSAQAQKLRRLAEARENQKSSRTSYVVSRLGVVETGGGGRTTVGAAATSPNLLYRIAVGVANTKAAANLRNTLLLVLAVSLLALGLAASFAVRGARRVVQPIERLVKVADAISMGDLTRPVQLERNDEIGDLSQALERMRLSLEAAMDRLRRRKR